MSEILIGQDVYIRLTDETGAHAPAINHHRVWDTRKFFAAQVELYKNPRDSDDKRTVSSATAEEYKQQGAH